MIKILFLQPGYAHYREDLFSILSKRHNIHFLFEKSKNTYPGEENPKQIKYTFIDKKFKNTFIGLIYYLYKYKYDIVISSVSSSTRSIVSFIFTLISKKKFILWILEWKRPIYKGNYYRKLIKTIKYWIGKRIIIQSHALIVGGAAARNYAIILGKNKREIFTALQCSKDIKKQKNPSKKNIYNNNKYTFLFLSRIIAWKGLDILIKAFYLLKQERNDISLLVAGDGPSKKHCLEMAKFLNISDVDFIGSINPNRTKEIYEKGDVFILPSYELDAFYEDWGLVVNEAMSMKLPLITTTGVGASFDMIVNGYNGFVVRENSVVELYQAMNNILKCDLFELGTNSRKVFDEKNNYEKMANGFSDAIGYVNKF